MCLKLQLYIGNFKYCRVILSLLNILLFIDKDVHWSDRSICSVFFYFNMFHQFMIHIRMWFELVFIEIRNAGMRDILASKLSITLANIVVNKCYNFQTVRTSSTTIQLKRKQNKPDIRLHTTAMNAICITKFSFAIMFHNEPDFFCWSDYVINVKECFPATAV